MIRLEGVSKTFPPERKIFAGINLEMAKGEWVWILGSTGIGKSVLLRIIYGSETLTEGSVTVLGDDVPGLKEKQLSKLLRRLGIVFQDIRLLDERTAIENIILVLRALGIPKPQAREKALYWLTRVGLADITERPAFELSVGQKQKVAMARALAKEPELLVLDEPFSALDENEEREMLKLLGEENHKGATILAASHEHEVLHFLPGRVLTLTPGGLE